MNFLEFVPLGPKTTLGVGGNARYFCQPQSIDALKTALDFAEERALSVLVLGDGSNSVISDQGWPGVVVQPQLDQLELNDSGRVTAGAGLSWDSFVSACCERGLAGVECLAGIPGTVGSTPIQNVGAYGQEVAETIVSVQVLDRATGEISEISASDCAFSYRQSRFNTYDLGKFIVLSVTFQLAPNGNPKLTYTDLQNHFSTDTAPTLSEVSDAVRLIRGRKGMVVSESDPDSRSAGSFFKNPILTQSQAEKLPDGAPKFPQADGSVKTSAAWLIDRSGLKRGQTLAGGIGLSSKHVLALVNQGNAVASDVAAAALVVQHHVLETFDIVLHPEPMFIGDWSATKLPSGASVVVP